MNEDTNKNKIELYNKNNFVHAVFLILTIKEIENNRFYLFIQKLKKFKPSKSILIPLYIFTDKLIDKTSIEKINTILTHFNINKFFSKIEIVNNNISDINNIYVPNKIENIPIFGTSSGPNLHFLKTINFELSKYKNILLLETDCFFISNYWLDYFNISIKKKTFWIYGSKYYGDSHFDDYTKQHINGVAIYNRCEDVMKFIDFVFFYIKTNILLKNEHIINYDIAINNVIDLFNKRKLLFDSGTILNISLEKDINIRNYTNIKKYTLLVHQKYF